MYCEDFEAVYALFDKDGNGKVDYDEFLRTLRGPMGDRRRALVDQAFGVLDTDGNGIIEPSEVVRKYDASATSGCPQRRQDRRRRIERVPGHL